jgi:cyclophilin family peptidyl-prolyl cis-trans isomerase
MVIRNLSPTPAGHANGKKLVSRPQPRYMNAMKKLPLSLLACFWLACAPVSFAGTLVQFHIYLGVADYLGDVDVELYDQDKPATVNNFLHLLKTGAFNNNFFHRLVPGFILQGGGNFAANPFSTNLVAPPYGSVGVVPNFGAIPGEAAKGHFYSNTNWTIAMALVGTNVNSATSEFFFNLTNNNNAAADGNLDNTSDGGPFTVFGHTVSGANILNIFNGFSDAFDVESYGLVDLDYLYSPATDPFGAGYFQNLPANIQGFEVVPAYDELVYYSVSLLTAQASLGPNGVRQISWNGVTGLTNNLEYTTNLTATTWQLLSSTVPTNSAPVIIPDNSSARTRYYRVQIKY